MKKKISISLILAMLVSLLLGGCAGDKKSGGYGGTDRRTAG